MAAEVGGRTTPGSGARWHSKGDVTTREWMVECKRTDKKQYILKAAEMKKLIVEALRDGKQPMMVVDMQGERYAVLPWSTWQQNKKEQ